MVASMHPQAKFDPIPPDLDLNELVEQTPNFKFAQRVKRSQIRGLGAQEFEKLVQVYVIERGQPLVIDGWDAVLSEKLFSAEWFEANFDKKEENVRDLVAGNNLPMTTGHYMRSMKQLTNQWTPANFRDERRQRMYLKDIDCPDQWHEALKRTLHPSLFYLNENVEAKRKNRRADDDDDMFIDDEEKPAIAGDLMSSLPEEMRAQNLMCYIGHEGTYTPAHREMCASLGQNIMVETSKDENGEKAGSSLWFMTDSKDRAVVREYFLSMLGHDIEIEKHFAQINAWKKAPFDVFIVEQKVGDFILIPPLAAHQVWNRGTRTMKVAWNRTTVETLDMALSEALPKARLVCRDEQYKNKSIIYFTLQKYYKQLENLQKISFLGIDQDFATSSPRTQQLALDFKKLVKLFADVLVDEMFAVKEKEPEYLEFDSNITCSYCRANIFNRFLTCKHCIRPLINGDEDTYDICMECYAMGRSCACLAGLQWCEQWKWLDLVEDYETWRLMVIKNDGYIDLNESPQPFDVLRVQAGKRSVAEICQDALKRRPWKDITRADREKTPEPSESEEEGAEPTAEQKRKKRNRKRRKHGQNTCHVCCHKDQNYRLQFCSNHGCSLAYCYGVLYRAFDMMPQDVLADEHWQCPKCRGICNCGACRRAGNTNAYTPKNTTLGLDTRPIADDRSVEALVDFRVHNLNWLKAVGEKSRSKDSKRMRRLREEADNEKTSAAAQKALEEGDEALRSAASGTPAENVEGAHSHDFTNGYGDQSHILGEQVALADYARAGTDAVLGQTDAEADITMGDATEVDLGDDSMYPDPTAMAHQRIGMGYYEQDDSADRILFDPYQEPAPETLVFDKSDVSEHVRKTLRAMKKKQKRADEDPEFLMSKDFYRRRQRLKNQAAQAKQQADPMDAMDPALFAQPGPDGDGHLSNEQILALTGATNPVEQPQQPQQDADDEGFATESRPPAPIPVMDIGDVPTLRHAKPRASYLEPDEIDVDALNEQMRQARYVSPVAGGTGPTGSPEPGQEGEDAIRQAAKMVRNMMNGTSGSTTANGKKRGRKPRAALDATDGEVEKPIPADGQIIRRRGRPRKSDTKAANVPTAAAAEELSEPEEPGTEEEAEPMFIDDTGDFRPTRSTRSGATGRSRGRPRGSGKSNGSRRTSGIEPDEDEPEVKSPRKRGRPRGSGRVTTIAEASRRRRSIDTSSSQDKPDFPAGEEEEEVKPKPKRGRPARKSEPVATVSEHVDDDFGNHSFTSMRDRLASRGKSFKMRGSGRKSIASAAAAASEASSPPPPPPVEDEQSDESDRPPPPPGVREDDDDDSDRPPPPPGGDGESDEDDGFASSSTDGSIEAEPRKPEIKVSAQRGRISGRGMSVRGRARGGRGTRGTRGVRR